MITAPGIYPELSERYHAEALTPTRCLTQSGIKVLLHETPFDYANPPEEEPSEEMNFGSIVHSLALGKLERFAISPFDDYRTKDARAWKEETIAAGQIPIKADKYDEAELVAAAIRDRLHSLIGDADYFTEVPFFWQEGETWCCGMADIWVPSLSLVIDPKVTGNIGLRAQSHIINMGWDIQAAWYRRGLEAITGQPVRFCNILAKPEHPFTTRVIGIGEGWHHSAEMECLRALRIFQECEASGVWPGYPDMEELDAPAWLLGQRMMAEVMEG